MKPLTVGDKAIVKHGFHTFEIGSNVVFVGMDYGQDEMTYMFSNGVIVLDLSENEFEWI